MKFEMKSLVAAALIATVSMANAAVVTGTVGVPVQVTDATTGRTAELTLLSGTGALYFSNGTADPITGVPTQSVGGLVGALNVGKVQLSPLDGAQVTQQNVTLTSPRGVVSTARGIVSIAAGVTSLTADTTTGQFSLVQAFGGAAQTALPLDGVLEGGSASITNLKIDLVGKKVYADVSSNVGTPFAFSQTNFHMWNITDISGPTSLPPSAVIAAADGNEAPLLGMGYVKESEVDGLYTLSTRNVLSGLKVTDAGFNFFADALGLTVGGTGYTTLQGVNNTVQGWGSLASDIRFTVREVPEPSTYALMGLGLVGISLVARRRAK